MLLAAGTVGKGTQQKYSHLTTACRTIWKEEGILGFYRGYSTSAIIMPVFWALYFPVGGHTQRSQFAHLHRGPLPARRSP